MEAIIAAWIAEIMTSDAHRHPEWPDFTWRQDELATLLARVRHRQGRLIGQMLGLGFGLWEEARRGGRRKDARRRISKPH